MPYKPLKTTLGSLLRLQSCEIEGQLLALNMDRTNLGLVNVLSIGIGHWWESILIHMF